MLESWGRNTEYRGWAHTALSQALLSTCVTLVLLQQGAPCQDPRKKEEARFSWHWTQRSYLGFVIPLKLTAPFQPRANGESPGCTPPFLLSCFLFSDLCTPPHPSLRSREGLYEPPEKCDKTGLFHLMNAMDYSKKILQSLPLLPCYSNSRFGSSFLWSIICWWSVLWA